MNDPAVIHQTIDGELVIIHLDRGVYFSLGSSGALIWTRLAAGERSSDVSRALARELGADEGAVAAAVDDLVERLSAEELLVPADSATADAGVDRQHDDDVTAGEVVDASAGPTGTFEPPVLQRYDDLQDLLLLDPIHAVDESGWPERRDHG